MMIKDNVYRVMELFFNAPEKKFHIREIARLTHLSAPGAIKIIDKLKKEGLLISRKEKAVENVWASRQEGFLVMKRCYNLKTLNGSGLIRYLKDRYEEPEAIVLFGSFSRGEDESTSDIDVAIVTGKRLDLDLKGFERKLKRKVNVHEVLLGEAEGEFLNTLANGIVVEGYLKVVG